MNNGFVQTISETLLLCEMVSAVFSAQKYVVQPVAPPSKKKSSSLRLLERIFLWLAAKSMRYVAANRMVNICTAENPWLMSTFVLTKLVPQNNMVMTARMCQMASELFVFINPVFTRENLKK